MSVAEAVAVVTGAQGYETALLIGVISVGFTAGALYFTISLWHHVSRYSAQERLPFSREEMEVSLRFFTLMLILGSSVIAGSGLDVLLSSLGIRSQTMVNLGIGIVLVGLTTFLAALAKES